MGITFRLTRSLRLPPRGRLPVTGPKDAIEQYYRPGIGTVFRHRLAWVRDCLPGRPVERLLEVGYGSGVFQYELARRAKLSVGVDVHPHGARVGRSLAADGVFAALVRADGTSLPFVDGSFDLVVIVSVLEHTSDPYRCLFECRRVLGPGGRLVCMVPRQMRWSDAVFRILTGIDPEADFLGGRARAREAIRRVIPGSRLLRRPVLLPRAMAPYEIAVFDSAARAAP